MAVNLVVAPEAAQDMDEAYSWYEERREGLGEEFLSCVDACIQAICRMPEIRATVHENYRRALVRRFPYAVFYEYSEETVTVYCVFHTAQDPEVASASALTKVMSRLRLDAKKTGNSSHC